jgi:hypothetical protein
MEMQQWVPLLCCPATKYVALLFRLGIKYYQCMYGYFRLSHSVCKSNLFCPVLYCHLWRVRLYHIFSILSQNSTIFGKIICWTRNVCIEFLYNPETFLIQGEFTEIRSQTYTGVHIKHPLRCHILTKLEFYQWSFHKTSYETSRKSVHWEPTCFMRTDGEAGTIRAITALRNFPNEPKNGLT